MVSACWQCPRGPPILRDTLLPSCWGAFFPHVGCASFACSQHLRLFITQLCFFSHLQQSTYLILELYPRLSPNAPKALNPKPPSYSSFMPPSESEQISTFHMTCLSKNVLPDMGLSSEIYTVTSQYRILDGDLHVLNKKKKKTCSPDPSKTWGENHSIGLHRGLRVRISQFLRETSTLLRTPSLTLDR